MGKKKTKADVVTKWVGIFFILIIVVMVLNVSMVYGCLKIEVAGATQNVTNLEGAIEEKFTEKEFLEPSSQLTINILNETIASGQWLIHLPDEFASYTPIEKDRLEENVDSLEKGMEDLFLQDVRNIEIVEGNENLIVTFTLKGDYTNGFVTGQYRYTYELTTYAPVGLSVLKIVIPQNKTLVSINPGPNEMEENEMVYYNYNWIYPIEIHYAEESTRAAKIGDKWSPQILPVKSKEFFGENEDSYFAIPDDWVGWGDDLVEGHKASLIAEYYKPRLYLWDTILDQCPDKVYYRVFKGKDPYIGFDAYLIQYFAYCDCKYTCLVSHDYDF
jgi:hypothetical protein